MSCDSQIVYTAICKVEYYRKGGAMQTYEIEAYLGNFAWEYDVEAIARQATDDMSAEDFAELCEKHNMHVKAIRSINRAYEAELYDEYENRLEHWSKKLGISYDRLEDDCTDVRMYGYDAS